MSLDFAGMAEATIVTRQGDAAANGGRRGNVLGRLLALASIGGGKGGGKGGDGKGKGRQRKGSWWKPSLTGVAGVALLVGLVAIRQWDPAPVEAARVQSFDSYNVIKPRAAPERSPVYIVDIDEKSLAELGQWPWPRTILADLVSALRDYGAPVVGFDVVFAEEDRTSPRRMAEFLPDADPSLIEALRALPSNDEVMAEAMRSQRVVVGQAGAKSARTREAPDAAQQTSFAAVRTTLGADPSVAEAAVLKFPTLIFNVPVLEEAAAGRGFFSVEEEVDGVVRRVPLLKEIDGVVKPALSIEMLRVAFGGNSIMGQVDPGGFRMVGLQIPGRGNYPVPVDANGRVWVYFAAPDAFNTPDNRGRLYVSATDIIHKRVPPEQLQGRLALVGTSAVGLLDIRSTPISPRLPGVEVHANLVETVLQQQYLKHPKEMHLIELIVAAVGGLLMIVIIPKLGPFIALGVLVVGVGGLVGASWYLFTTELTFLDATYPSAVIAFLFAFTAFSNYVRDAAEKRQVRSAFSQYLSPDLVEQLAENPDQLRLGGETKRMTLLFCDVRGFTSISELFKDNPEGLTILINRLLTPLTDSILRRRGTIDKYMGDCIMAFWNAPLDVEDQEANACAAALDMFKDLEVLNEERRKECEADGTKFLPLNIGIGLNTGDVVVGNMGSQQRFDYSVLGDAVNLAARLEGQSKSYGVGVVIGEATNEAAKDRYATLELDLIAVKGKAEAVRIFALLGAEDMLGDPEFQTLKAEHDAFQAAYRAQDWDRAEALLEDNKNRLGGAMAGFCDIFLERIAEFRQNPPPADWDGVYVATTK